MSTDNTLTTTHKFPSHWTVESFEDAIFDETGGHPKIKRGDYEVTGTIPVIDQGRDFIGGYVDDEGLICDVRLPCILFGDHTKIFKWCDMPFALGADGVKVLTTRDDIYPRFAYWYLTHLRLPNNAGYSRHFKFLKRSEIPLPPLSEQKRIADILDKADAIRRKRQESIDTAETLLGSAFQGYFGDPVANAEELPLVSLGDADIHISDGNYSSKYPKTKDFIDAGVPFIRANNLKRRTVIADDMRFISSRQHSELRKGHLKANDVLIVTRGNIGEVALVPKQFEDANINAQLVLLRPTTNQFRSEFLLGYFCVPSVRAQVMRLQTGTALKQLPVGQLVQLKLPLVSEEKQKRFAELFQQQQQALARLTKYRDESDHLFSSLVQRAFKGEL